MHFGVVLLLQGRSRHTRADAQQYLHFFGVEYSDLELEGRDQSVAELLVAPMAKTPCSSTAVLFLRGKVGALMDGAAEVDKPVLPGISLARILDLKLDASNALPHKHTASIFFSDATSPNISRTSTNTATTSFVTSSGDYDAMPAPSPYSTPYTTRRTVVSISSSVSPTTS